jgi:hypothetical protein
MSEAPGCCVNPDMQYALINAARDGHIECLLRAKGTSGHQRAIETAAQHGQLECMRIIWGWGHELNAQRIFFWAAGGGSPKCLSLAKEWSVAPDLNQGLRAAAEVGSTSCMSLLKTWGATEYGDAICNGHEDCMRLAGEWYLAERSIHCPFVPVGPFTQFLLDDAIRLASRDGHAGCAELARSWREQYCPAG